MHPEGAGSTGESSVVRWFAVVVAAAAFLRIAAGVIAGIVEWANPSFPGEPVDPGQVLLTFGRPGDVFGAVMALVVVGLAWWSARGLPPEQRWTRTGLFDTAQVLFALTGVASLVLLSAVIDLEVSSDQRQWSSFVSETGSVLAGAIICTGGYVFVRRLRNALLFAVPAGEAGDPGPAVFAVDRHNGDVHAYVSLRDAEDRVPRYCVEDGVFDFYTDDGTLVVATLGPRGLDLAPTDERKADLLMQQLRAFAERRGIVLDPTEQDDPLAYAVAFSDRQSLEAWPAWARWVPLLGRRVRG